MKRIVFFILVCVLFCVSCKAQEQEFSYNQNDETEYISEEEVSQIKDALPQDVLEFLYECEIEPNNPATLENITSKGVLFALLDFLKQRLTSPFNMLFTCLAVIIISAFVHSLQKDDNPALTNTVSVVGNLSVAIAVVVPLTSLLGATSKAIVSCGVFVSALIPVFAGILIASARAGTAAGLNSVLFFASQFISQIGVTVVKPLCSIFLSLSVVSGISKEIRMSSLLQTLKKTLVWILGGMTFVFVAILSLQTVIGGVADTATNKTAKFLIGSFVPIIGSSISEALGAVMTSVGVLKTGIGIYAVVVLMCITIPIIIEICLWKLCFSLSCAVSEFLGMESIKNLIFSISEALTVMLSLLICVSILFIISITIVNMAGGSI